MSRNYFEFTFAISQCMHFCFIGQSGAKILNITTQGGKIISTGAGRNPNVVTVNPKTLQLHAVKTPGSKHGKKLYLFCLLFKLHWIVHFSNVRIRNSIKIFQAKPMNIYVKNID